ncbi:Penicillin-binding protein PbpX [Macrococcoides canis]|uniref:Penicillin-binding protein PbpX n=1 Tax=Macrococcoides canis TaxID=1855823 RepID=A0A1W7A9V5_9STAP|nr:serine hydrolase domain-containing protein [Macrococcus canis]ARQ06415.1 Putative penicillin-binding protein PbpX [Macrococcus canis]
MKIETNARFIARQKNNTGISELEFLNNKHFNGQIRVRENMHTIIHESYGFKNLNFDPISYDTQFLTASIQKFITGIVIEQLIEEGKLKRFDAVNKYIYNIPGHITIEDLLLHISGLTPYKVYQNFHGLEQSIKLIQKSGATLPYHQFDYNDANYIILAKIIEIIENKSYRLVLYDRIIDKYELTNTCFYNETKDATTGIHQFGRFLIEDWHNDLDKYYGAGNMYMSLSDIDTLCRLFAQYHTFNEQKTQEIIRPDRFLKQKYRSGISLRPPYLRIRGTLYAHDVVAYFNAERFIAVATNRQSNEYKAEEIVTKLLNIY